LMAVDVFRVVVVEPEIGGEDGVAFAVGAKGGLGQAACAWLGRGWDRVPFVIAPEPHDDQFVVYRGRDDFSEGSTRAVPLDEAILGLFWTW
jgi:hypothetical protein